MFQSSEVCLVIADHYDLIFKAETVYHRVWRFDFTTPGFVVLDVPPGTDSYMLRAWMVDLKHRLSEIGISRGTGLFCYKSMSRFDQQVTTKFHLDGAPERSLLMLGYEPSLVHSRLFMADYSHAAFDLGLTPQQYIQEFNPMYKKGEEQLADYITELPQPKDGHSQILLINNSTLSFTNNRSNSLGVMHKAIIVNPDDSLRRIVNSTMLAIGEKDDITEDQQKEFVATEEISKRIY